MIVSLLAAYQASWSQALPYQVDVGKPSLSVLRERLRKLHSAAWLEGDMLTFATHAKSDMVRVTGSVEQAMTRAGGDLWTLRLRMKDWSRMNVRYAFFTSEGGTGKVQVWRGRLAPPLPVIASTLKGRIVERTLHSESLGEDRKLTVYLPPGSDGKGLPAFYMADGQSCETFARVLEPLILAGKVASAAIVGMNNATDNLADKPMPELIAARSAEYFPYRDRSRFVHHETFFVTEAMPFAQREFGLSDERKDKTVMGYSDGGSFAEAVAAHYQDRFGAAIPLSPGWPMKFDASPPWDPPRLYFAAGCLEPFFRTTKRSYDEAKKLSTVSALFRTYFGGHEEWTWTSAFAEIAPLVFPPVKRTP